MMTLESNVSYGQNLRMISTVTADIADPSRFVTRYGAAIRAYLRALIPNSHDADEVEQDFLLRVIERGFPDGQGRRGPFRYYLMTVVRNAALAYFRKSQRRPMTVADLSAIPAAEFADREWNRKWRECVMKNAWLALRQHEQRNSGNLCHTVLRAAVKHPEEGSKMLAARVYSLTGQEMTAEAFRKQLSRARRRFGEFIVQEVSRTLISVTTELIDEELQSLNLWKYVRVPNE